MRESIKQHSEKWLVIYHLIVALLAIASSALAILMMLNVKVGLAGMVAYQVLLAFFVIDYIIRLIFTQNRKWFLINNAFDLLGILPMHPAFSLFRLARIFRMIRTHHLFWRLGISGKWTRDFHRFTYDTGFIYLFTISVVIICLSALLFSIVEHQTLSESLWWAITTATTVGYGDDSPRTAWGKRMSSNSKMKL